MYSAILMMTLAAQPVIYEREEQAGPKGMPKCNCMNDGSPCICAPGRCTCEVGDYTKPKEGGKPAVVFVGMPPRHVEGMIVQKSKDLYGFGLKSAGIVVWDGKQRLDLPPNASNKEIRRAAFPPAPRMESGAGQADQRLQQWSAVPSRSFRGGSC